MKKDQIGPSLNRIIPFYWHPSRNPRPKAILMFIDDIARHRINDENAALKLIRWRAAPQASSSLRAFNFSNALQNFTPSLTGRKLRVANTPL
jgi:hypothetical protein